MGRQVLKITVLQTQDTKLQKVPSHATYKYTVLCLRKDIAGMLRESHKDPAGQHGQAQQEGWSPGLR